MPTSAGPHLQGKSNLALAFDIGDILNSYLGEPTTNTIPSPTLNAYPTYGNGWATYNTNQYCGNNGCGNFWSIPSIVSVSGNIVTTSGPHTMRTFDVLRPQGSGGGLTANTDYLVRAWNSTQFSLYAYNNSQDGSQGYINPSTGWYKVQDDYATDTRVAVNATSFPTMWWGYPHLPNSGLIKEVISKGCNLFLTKTDCLRLHWYRPDGVCDGMAYGVTPSVTNGVTYTLSFWMKAVDAAAAGNGGSVQFYNTGNATWGGQGFTLGAVNEWIRYQLTTTATATGVYLFYFFPNSGPMTVDIANFQFEQKSHATQFTVSARSNTNGLLDLTGKNTLDLSNMSYNTNAQMVFDGASNYINFGVTSGGIGGLSEATMELVINQTFPSSYQQIFGFRNDSTFDFYFLATSGGGTEFRARNSAGTYYDSNPSIAAYSGKYVHIIFSIGANGSQVYYNGTLVYSAGWSGALGSSSPFNIGRNASGMWFANGTMPIAKLYTKQLSSTEVTQNYNQYKTRFNLS